MTKGTLQKNKNSTFRTHVRISILSLMQYCLIISFICFMYSESFQGRVINESGKPIVGVNVEIVDSGLGTTTDSDGFFSLSLDKNLEYLSIKLSHIGYSPKTIELSNFDNMDFILYESSLKVNPIVTTGLRRKSYIKDVPVRTHVINTEDIKNSGVASIKDLLELAIPNVQNVMSSHAGISNDNVKIQGLDNRYMLFLVDGARVSGEFAGNLDFNMLNLSNVERIEIIEGGMSSLYGSSAIGGVVNIITKKPEKSYEFDFSYFYDDPMVVSKSMNMGFNYKKMR